MFDDGAHDDGAAVMACLVRPPIFPPAAGSIVTSRARATNAAQTARFAPARAEQVTYDYTVALSVSTDTGVVLNNS